MNNELWKETQESNGRVAFEEGHRVLRGKSRRETYTSIPISMWVVQEEAAHMKSEVQEKTLVKDKGKSG